MPNEITLDATIEFTVDNRGKSCPTVTTGIPLIATNCVTNDYLYPTDDKLRFVDQETYDTWFRAHPQPGDLLFVNKGTPGRVCMVPNPVNFCIAQDMVALRIDNKVIYPKYLFAALRAPIIQSRIKNLSTDAVIPHFRKTDFDRLKIPFPNRRVQENIGDLYFVFSKAIENNNRRIQILEKMTQRIYREWFVHFRFPGHENVKMVDSELGKIPEGWEVRNLKSLLSGTIGGDWGKEQPESDYEFEVQIVRGSDIARIKNGSISSQSLPRRFIKEASFHKRQLRVGDIILENSVNSSTRSIGTSLHISESLLSKFGPNLISASFCKQFSFTNQLDALLIHHHVQHLRQTKLMEFYQNVATNGIANFQSTRFINDEYLAIPCEPRFRIQLLQELSELADMSTALCGANQTLRKTRDLLLPRLISGRLDVEDLEIAG